MVEFISLPAAADLETYTMVRITQNGADVAVPPDAGTGAAAKVDGVVYPNALPLTTGTIANIAVIGIAKVKLAAGESPKPGDLVAPNANGYAVVDNTYGKYKVVRTAGEYAEIIIK